MSSTTLELAPMTVDAFVEQFLEVEDKEVAQKARLYKKEMLATFDEFVARKHYAGVLAHLARLHGHKAGKAEIMAFIAQNTEVHILDAGCGVGSESLLFAYLGARVTGVDIMEERLSLARSRVPFFQSEAAKDVNVEFILGDLFSIMGTQQFDAIWIREAISHIHPLEKFLDCAHQSLRAEGKIFVSDSNWANPMVKLETYRNYRNRLKWYHLLTRWREAGLFYVEDGYYDPITGRHVAMAQERMFSPRGFRSLLESRGFRVVGQRTIGFLPKTRLCLPRQGWRAIAS